MRSGDAPSAAKRERRCVPIDFVLVLLARGSLRESRSWARSCRVRPAGRARWPRPSRRRSAPRPSTPYGRSTLPLPFRPGQAFGSECRFVIRCDWRCVAAAAAAQLARAGWRRHAGRRRSAAAADPSCESALDIEAATWRRRACHTTRGRAEGCIAAYEARLRASANVTVHVLRRPQGQGVEAVGSIIQASPRVRGREPARRLNLTERGCRWCSPGTFDRCLCCGELRQSLDEALHSCPTEYRPLGAGSAAAP
jgi:hypothetical protein